MLGRVQCGLDRHGSDCLPHFFADAVVHRDASEGDAPRLAMVQCAAVAAVA